MARVQLGTVGAIAAAAVLLSCQRGGQDDGGRIGRSPEAAESRREARAVERREEARRARAAPTRAGGRPSTEEARGDATARDDAGETRRAQAPVGQDGTETRPEGALSHAWQGTVEGRVVRASEREIVLRPEGAGPDVRLRVAPDTAVTVDGARSSVSELREGTEVRASFAQQGGEPVATRIEAL